MKNFSTSIQRRKRGKRTFSHGRQIESLRRQVESLNGRVQVLSDRIFYAPNLELVEHLGRRAVGLGMDQHQIRELLKPIQFALHDTVLASRLVPTPAALKIEMQRDPWYVLDDIRPLNYVKAEIHPGRVPVVFFDSQMPLLGWIDSATLTRDFNINYCPTIPGDRKRVERTFVDMRTSKMGHVRVYKYTTQRVSITCLRCSGLINVTLRSNENYLVCPHCHRRQIRNISWSTV